MQDGKALQAGTSHFLGQNFAKAFDVKFMNENNKEEYVWATSWGVSTRLMGALIMTHSDDAGLVIPPKLAPTKVMIVPIPKPAEVIDEQAHNIMDALKQQGISVKYDTDPKKRPGFKFAQYELEGVPVRIGIGKRDLEKGMVEVARRDTKEKVSVPVDGVANYIANLLDEIQDNLFQRALQHREDHTTTVDTKEEFEQVLEEKGGFLLTHWDGTTETELLVKEQTKATIRCIPLDQEKEEGVDPFSGKPSQGRVVYARAY
jgi:prolyl-tRNA synthetase